MPDPIRHSSPPEAANADAAPSQGDPPSTGDARLDAARARRLADARAEAQAVAEGHRPRGSYLYLILGWLMVGLGLIGAVLPLLPTTIFMILAAGFFTRGSPRARAWLLAHRLFGPAIVRWEETGGIPRKGKIAAVAAMIAAPVLSWALGVPGWVLAVQVVALVSAGLYVVTRPD